MSKPFKNLTFLVTKPKERAGYLIKQLQAHGAHVIEFPTITFADPPQLEQAQTTIKSLTQFDMAIFTSPTAVIKTLALLKKYNTTLPKQLTLATVGSTSAHCLQQANLQPIIVPDKDFTSEGLLAMPLLTDIRNKKIAIFTGVGGRTLLENTLQQRGATVNSIAVYQRVKPNVLDKNLNTIWQKTKLDLIITTSQEGLKNLWDMVDTDTQAYLATIPLLIVQARTKNTAKHLGHHGTIILADNATDDAILHAITSEIKNV